jgi:hypothetical protein
MSANLEEGNGTVETVKMLVEVRKPSGTYLVVPASARRIGNAI